ncbi:hypothetical protein [Glutamicibacter soli]
MEPENQNAQNHPGIKKFLKRIGACLVAIGVFAGGLAAFLDNGTNFLNNVSTSPAFKPEHNQVQPGQSSPAVQAPATTPEADNTLSSLSPGDFDEGCFLAEQDNLKRIACDSPHNAEIFAPSQSCNQETLFKYLGGVPGVDVLRRGMDITDATGKGCMLTLPPEIQLTTTAAMSLTNKNSEFMRQCYDAKTNSDVGCDEIHTAEVVKTFAPESTETANCVEAAERYLGISSANFTTQLTVEQQESNDSRRCVVAAKGDNILTATLRDISNSSLPLTADDGIRN